MSANQDLENLGIELELQSNAYCLGTEDKLSKSSKIKLKKPAERNFVNYGNVEHEHKIVKSKRSPKVIDDGTANVSDSNETLEMEQSQEDQKSKEASPKRDTTNRANELMK